MMKAGIFNPPHLVDCLLVCAINLFVLPIENSSFGYKDTYNIFSLFTNTLFYSYLYRWLNLRFRLKFDALNDSQNKREKSY